jgi:hypothetical protein
MATTKKKTTTKKTSAPKKTTARATVTKKAPVKKTTAKRAPKRTSSKKTPEMRSFHIAKESQEFTKFKVTRQTVYWVILVAFIIFAQLWILKLQVDVATLIDAQQQQLLNI